MARIRTVKPGFFVSDDVCALSPLARLLYIGLWCEADREGRMEWKPKTFKRQYLPDDDCDIDSVCAELVTRGVIVLYDQGLAYVPAFLKHQVINLREAQSKYPEPPADACNAHALPAITPGKGKEGEGKGKDSEANASGAHAPDPVKVLFDEGVKLLIEHDCKASNARSIIAKWRKERGDEATMAAILAFRLSSSTEPISWITQRLADKPRETFDQRRIREGMAVIHDYEAEHDRH